LKLVADDRRDSKELIAPLEQKVEEYPDYSKFKDAYQLFVEYTDWSKFRKEQVLKASVELKWSILTCYYGKKVMSQMVNYYTLHS
jgi:hypothetical protein